MEEYIKITLIYQIAHDFFPHNDTTNPQNLSTGLPGL